MTSPTTEWTPLQILESYLRLKYPYYTVSDVELSTVKGYLKTTKRHRGHYHTIDITGVGYYYKDEKGRFISPYRLWHELHGVLPVAKEGIL